MTLRHRVHRVLYVPLDDRPVNLRMPALLAGIVDYEMSLPPRELLGCYDRPGRPEALAEWLLSHTDEHQDCIILSLDMLLYGGLVASRTPTVLPEIAQQRLQLLEELRSQFPEVSLYASSTLCRLDFGMSEEDRLRWGESFYRFTRLADAPEQQEEVEQVVDSLPQSLVDQYRQVRRRNHELNLAAIDQVAASNLDFLILAQDDADVQGFHIAEQQALAARVKQAGVADQVVICAGADETGTTLFSRFVHTHMEEAPQVAVMYCDHDGAACVAPFEDRPFGENLRQQAKAAGVALIDDPQAAEMLLAISPPVAGPREAVTGCPEYQQRRKNLEEFARQIADWADRRGVAICDAAFPNGAEDAFMEALSAAGVTRPRLLSFAAWNTAGNSLGAALAHGSVRLIGLRDKAAFDLAQLVTSISPMRYFELLNSLINAEKAHLQLLLTRLVDDWLYQTRVRPVVCERLGELVASAGFDLTQAYAWAEGMVREMLTEAVANLWVEEFMGQQASAIGSPGRRSGLVLAELQDTRISLPWRRLFEVELEFDLGLELTAPAGETAK